jgi:hypothetical protein
MSLASLRSTRRVLRLGGSDVLHFLQVSRSAQLKGRKEQEMSWESER